MKNQIVSVERYARPTVYGIILIFTATYSSGKSRRWILRDNPYGYWHGSWHCNTISIPLDQLHQLPNTVVSFLWRRSSLGSLYRDGDVFITKWG